MSSSGRPSKPVQPPASSSISKKHTKEPTRSATHQWTTPKSTVASSLRKPSAVAATGVTTLQQLQERVESTLMELMSAIRKGKDDIVERIMKQWPSMYRMIYQVTTEEDVPYEMYLLMVQNVVQVLVVHALSFILKDGEEKGLLPSTLHSISTRPEQHRKKTRDVSPSTKHEETVALQRDESEREVLVVRSPNHSSRSSPTTIARWNEEYQHFKLFCKYTSSIFQYLDQYVTVEWGLEEVKQMCVKLFYVVVFEPTRRLQLAELSHEMAHVLNDMLYAFVTAVSSSGGDSRSPSKETCVFRQSLSSSNSSTSALKPHGEPPPPPVYVDPSTGGAAATGAMSRPPPHPSLPSPAGGGGAVSASETSFLSGVDNNPSTGHANAMLLCAPTSLPAEHLRADSAWRAARSLLSTLQADPRFLAVQQVLDSWSEFLSEVNQPSRCAARQHRHQQQRGQNSKHNANPQSAPHSSGRSSVTPPTFTAASPTPTKSSHGDGCAQSPPTDPLSLAVGPPTVNLDELERLQEFLALPPSTRRQRKIPAMSQNASASTMKELVHSVCGMINAFRPHVGDALQRLSRSSCFFTPQDSFLTRVSSASGSTQSRPVRIRHEEVDGPNSREGESWQQVLLRVLLWDTAIRLLGPLWANPEVCRTLRAALSPPPGHATSMISNPYFSFKVLVMKWLDVRRSPAPPPTAAAEAVTERRTLLRDLEDALYTITCMMKYTGSNDNNSMLAEVVLVLESLVTRDAEQLLIQYNAASPVGADRKGLKLVDELNQVHALYKYLNDQCLNSQLVIQNALDQALRKVLLFKHRRPGEQGARSMSTAMPSHHQSSPTPVGATTSLSPPHPQQVMNSGLLPSTETGFPRPPPVVQSIKKRGLSSKEPDADLEPPQRMPSTTEDTAEGDTAPSSPLNSTVRSSRTNRDVFQSQSPDPIQPSSRALPFRPVDMAKLFVDYFYHYALLEDEVAVAETSTQSSKTCNPASVLSSGTASPGDATRSSGSAKMRSSDCKKRYTSVALWVGLLNAADAFARHFQKRMMTRLLAPQPIPQCLQSNGGHSDSSAADNKSSQLEVKRLLEKLVLAGVPLPRSIIVNWATLLFHMQPADMYEPLCRAGAAAPRVQRPLLPLSDTNCRSSSLDALPLLRVKLFSRRNWHLPQLLPHGLESSTTHSSSAVAGTGPNIPMPLPVQSALNRMTGRLSQTYPFRKLEWVHMKGYVVFAGIFPNTKRTVVPSPGGEVSGGDAPAVVLITAHLLQGAILYWISESLYPVLSAPPPVTTTAHEYRGITGTELAKKLGMSFADLQPHLQVLLESPLPKVSTPLVCCRKTTEDASRVPLEDGVYTLNPQFEYPASLQHLPLKLSPIMPHCGAGGGRYPRGSISNHSFRGGRQAKDGVLTGGAAVSSSHFSWEDRLQASIMAHLKKSGATPPSEVVELAVLLKALRSQFGSPIELPQVKLALERLIEMGYVKRCEGPSHQEVSRQRIHHPPTLHVGSSQHYCLVP